MLEGQPHYRLGLQGLGLGDALEMLTLHSTVKRDDKVGRRGLSMGHHLRTRQSSGHSFTMVVCCGRAR